MGWGSGVNYEGREIGYTREGVCETEGCDVKIDLGLGYCCGELLGVSGEEGCGHYFCGDHLFYTPLGQRCPPCADEDEKTHCGECGHLWEFHSDAGCDQPSNSDELGVCRCAMEVPA